MRGTKASLPQKRPLSKSSLTPFEKNSHRSKSSSQNNGNSLSKSSSELIVSSSSVLDPKSYISETMRAILGIVDGAGAPEAQQPQSLENLPLNLYSSPLKQIVNDSGDKVSSPPRSHKPAEMQVRELTLVSPNKRGAIELRENSSAQKSAGSLIYNSLFSGLQSTGASGMTVLEELIDVAFRACEKGRQAGQQKHARGAALLCADGRVFSGCDVSSPHENAASLHAITAERVAVLAAVSDGVSKFECMVVASDTMLSFPTPDGSSREYMSAFGIFPVILVNCQLEAKHTSTMQLFPFPFLERADHSLGSSKLQESAITPTLLTSVDPFLEENDDILSWSIEDVGLWLDRKGLNELRTECAVSQVDGAQLLRLDEEFLRQKLEIRNPLMRKKFLRCVSELRQHQLGIFFIFTFLFVSVACFY